VGPRHRRAQSQQLLPKPPVSTPTALMAMPFGALITQIVLVTDPVAYLASLGVVVAACLLATWIPAARAAKVDPMRALRRE
jgi:ABC-type lipoprotein release transport system permease subunit